MAGNLGILGGKSMRQAIVQSIPKDARSNTLWCIATSHPPPPPPPPPRANNGTKMPATAEPSHADPLSTLLSRVRAELLADFAPDQPIRVARAPGRLDVMGGIADYTGSLVCEMPLDRAAAVALRERDDREVQVFSFNLHDEAKPFTLRIPLDAIATQPLDALRREFA